MSTWKTAGGATENRSVNPDVDAIVARGKALAGEFPTQPDEGGEEKTQGVFDREAELADLQKFLEGVPDSDKDRATVEYLATKDKGEPVTIDPPKDPPAKGEVAGNSFSGNSPVMSRTQRLNRGPLEMKPGQSVVDALFERSAQKKVSDVAPEAVRSNISSYLDQKYGNKTAAEIRAAGPARKRDRNPIPTTEPVKSSEQVVDPTVSAEESVSEEKANVIEATAKPLENYQGNSWETPSEVMTYLQSLIRSAKLEVRQKELRWLEFAVSGHQSRTEVEKMIQEATNNGLLQGGEYSTIKRLVEGENVAKISNQEVVDVRTPLLEEEMLPVPAVDETIDWSVEKPTVSEQAKNLSVEQMKELVVTTGNVCAFEESLWSQAVNDRKSKWQKIVEGLGTDRKPPEVEKVEKHIEAEKKYYEARKQLALAFAEEDKVSNDPEFIKRAFDQAESECQRYQAKIAEHMPPGKLERMKKALGERYDKASPVTKKILGSKIARAGITATVAGAAAFAFGTVGLTGAAIVAGGRGIRSIASSFGAVGGGKAVDSITKKKAEKRQAEALEDYARNFKPDNFDEREAAVTAFVRSERNKAKRDRKLKAIGMLVGGLGAGLTTTVGMNEIFGGTGVSLHHSNDGLQGNGTRPIQPLRVESATTPKAPATIEPEHIKPVMTARGPAVPETPKIAVQPEILVPHFEPVSVELSSKGFLDTFAHLKEQLGSQYHDIATAPKGVQDILNSSPEKLAIKYGFYQPSEHLSGFGMKGEHLVVDPNGNLVLEHLNGNKEIFFDAKTSSVHQYAGPRMDTAGHVVTAETHVESPVETPVHADMVEASHEVPGVPSADTAPLVGEAVEASSAALVAPLVVGSMRAAARVLILGGEPVKPLDKTFQIDNSVAGKAARKKYAIELQKQFATAPTGSFDSHISTSFNDGIVDIVQKGNEVKAFLNGEKIAEGSVNESGPLLTYDRTLGTSLLGSKTVYELAYDKAKEVMNKNMNKFKMVALK